VLAAARDTNLAYAVHTASTWEIADAAHTGVNNILVLDCLQTVAWNAKLAQPVIGSNKILWAIAHSSSDTILI
jgi:hypothetical protein